MKHEKKGLIEVLHAILFYKTIERLVAAILHNINHYYRQNNTFVL